MSPEAQRIAIAEACPPKMHGKPSISETDDGRLIWTDGWGDEEPVPNYLNDLNAIRDIEELLDEQQQATYTLFLHGLSKRPKADYLGRDFDAIHATAAQKAEYLIRTLNLWDDSK